MIPKNFFLLLSFSRIKLANIKIPTNKIIFDAVKYFITYLHSNLIKSTFHE